VDLPVPVGISETLLCPMPDVSQFLRMFAGTLTYSEPRTVSVIISHNMLQLLVLLLLLLLLLLILLVVLYGCETWSVTLREENRLNVFENRVLRRIYGPRGDEVTGEWKKLHTEELHDL
jgi:hypothetical protein